MCPSDRIHCDKLMDVAVPILGLTVAAAPGFAHYLPFLQPLSNSNGLGSGIVGGLVPAIAMTLTVAAAVFATRRELVY